MFFISTNFMLKHKMIDQINNFKIFKSIVLFVAVYVVNLFSFVKFSAQMFFHYDTMLIKFCTTYIKQNVTSRMSCFSIFPVMMIFSIKIGNCAGVNRIGFFIATLRAISSPSLLDVSHLGKKILSTVFAMFSQTFFAISSSVTSLKGRFTDFAYFCKRLEVVHSYSRYCTQEFLICK